MPRKTSLSSILKRQDWNLKEIEKCLATDSSCLNKEDSNGEMPLFYVIRNKTFPLDVISLLLKYGADINFKTKLNYTPLIVALETSRDAEVIRALLEKGAKANWLYGGRTDRRSSLCMALHSDASIDVIQLLLDAGCTLNKCRIHRSALHCALDDPCPDLKEDVLQLLIDRGANINATDKIGRSVVCHAIAKDNTHPIEMLLAKGGALDACTRHRHNGTNTAFWCAVTAKRQLTVSLIKLLINNGAVLENLDSMGHSLIHGTLWHGRYEKSVLVWLLDHLADVNAVDRFENSLLLVALQNKTCCTPSIVKLLLERGVSLDRPNIDGLTPLHQAAVLDSDFAVNIIKMMLKLGADVNAKSRMGYTPLQLAVWTVNSSTSIKVLLAAGARVNELLLENIADLKSADYFKVILQYYLLENPDFNIDSFMEGYEDFKIMAKFRKDCVNEVREMDKVSVGQCCTLRGFLREYFSYQKKAADCNMAVRKYDWHQLLRIKADNKFLLFSDIIWQKVDRPFMNVELEKLQVYAEVCTPYKREKVILEHYDVCEIVKYLGNDSFFNLISAFNHIEDDPCSSEAKEELLKLKKQEPKMGLKRKRGQEENRFREKGKVQEPKKDKKEKSLGEKKTAQEAKNGQKVKQLGEKRKAQEPKGQQKQLGRKRKVQEHNMDQEEKQNGKKRKVQEPKNGRKVKQLGGKVQEPKRGQEEKRLGRKRKAQEPKKSLEEKQLGGKRNVQEPKRDKGEKQLGGKRNVQEPKRGKGEKRLGGKAKEPKRGKREKQLGGNAKEPKKSQKRLKRVTKSALK